MSIWAEGVEQQDTAVFGTLNILFDGNHFYNTNALQTFTYQQGFGNLFEVQFEGNFQQE